MTAMEDPYSAGVANALAAGPLEHVARIVATHPDWAQDITLEVDSASVTFDEGWAPHVQATLQCRLPDDLGVLSDLDPRAGVRVQIETGYVLDGAEDVHLLADLGLRSRTTLRPANLLRIQASGDEAILQDNLWSDSTPGAVPTTGLVEAVEWLIDQGTSGTYVLDSDIPTGYNAGALTEAAMPTGDDFWSVLSGVVDDGGAWVRDDGTRTFRLGERPSVAGVSRAQLATGPGGTVVDAEESLDRDLWANAVLVRSAWRDSLGADRLVIARSWVSSGDMAPGAAGWRWRRVDRSSPTTQAAANAAAGAILQRTVTRGRGHTIGAKAAYWLRPGQTVTVQPVSGDQERQIVARVKFDLPSGLMTVTTRQPESVETTNGE